MIPTAVGRIKVVAMMRTSIIEVLGKKILDTM